MFSRSFVVSGLTFRSLIHFEFIFVYGVRKCSSFILLQVVDQFPGKDFIVGVYFYFLNVSDLLLSKASFKILHSIFPVWRNS